MRRNKYPGKCACGCNVEIDGGLLQARSDRYGKSSRYVVVCVSCYDKRDKASAEDRQCEEAAYKTL